MQNVTLVMSVNKTTMCWDEIWGSSSIIFMGVAILPELCRRSLHQMLELVSFVEEDSGYCGEVIGKCSVYPLSDVPVGILHCASLLTVKETWSRIVFAESGLSFV